ncbi:MAG: L,D-transpeptidase [Anaerolineales bacterium]|nr:L,D-transpeptidase [Anaerolineales bacterium]
MVKRLSRRDFLKLGGLALGGLALSAGDSQAQVNRLDDYQPDFPRQPEQDQGKLARVGTRQVDVRALPNDQSPIVGNRFRDQVFHVYEELHPPDAPVFYNTLWYRVWGGYMHSARLQIVEVRLNEPALSAPKAGHLSEVTVPYTTAYQHSQWDGWFPWRGSRLYYSSTHWVTGVEVGPDGGAWYQLTSELSKTEIYYAKAEHLRLIKPEEYAPISPNTAPEKKRIEVSLSEQKLRAFEDGKLVLETKISSGIPNPRLDDDELPTSTPEGEFVIYSKMPSKHMGSVAGGPEVEESGGFTLPGVPWTMFFRSPGGYALHGTYWHNNFGLQMSHGCVNMRNEDARWLFRWSMPLFDPFKIESPSDWEVTGNGTKVVVRP